jgi:hypothetical protein
MPRPRELMGKVNGELPYGRDERRLVARGARIKDEADITRFILGAQAAVTEYAMETAVELEMRRRGIAGGDMSMMALTAPFMATGCAQMLRAQRQFLDEWGS